MDIILGKERKRWSDDQKREIVAEAIASGEVTSVARRHGANPSMVSGWRKRFLEEQPAAAAATFMPVALSTATQPHAATETPTIDLAFAYLSDVLAKISDSWPMSRLDDLLPWNYVTPR